MNLREIAEFAGIETRYRVLVAYRDKDRLEDGGRDMTDVEIESDLLSPPGTIAIMKALIKQFGDLTCQYERGEPDVGINPHYVILYEDLVTDVGGFNRRVAHRLGFADDLPHAILEAVKQMEVTHAEIK